MTLTAATRPTTVYTRRLAGASLDALLDAAERDEWPNSQCVAEWLLLRTWAIQAETLTIDEDENAAWELAMRDLAARDLPYEEWVTARMDALRDRLRGRKLHQARLRYAFGFKPGRRPKLVAREVRRFYRSWSGLELDD